MTGLALPLSFDTWRRAGCLDPCPHVLSKHATDHRRRGRLKFARKLVLLAAASLIVSNCSSTPERLPRLAEDIETSLEAVGVITIGPPIGGSPDEPATHGDQVAMGIIDDEGLGVAGGAMAGLLTAGWLCGPAYAVCVLGGAAAGGMISLVGGTGRGEIGGVEAAIDQNTVAEIESALAHAIAGNELQSDLRRRVLRNIGNASSGIDLGTGAPAPLESPDYASLANRNINAVLEISVTQLGFASPGGDDPVLALVMTARARLIAVPDNGVLWNVEQVTYESAEAEFSFWTEVDTGLLQAEIDDGLDTLAGRISEALFGASAA